MSVLSEGIETQSYPSEAGGDYVFLAPSPPAPLFNADPNCGIGPGGFQPGNTCAAGGAAPGGIPGKVSVGDKVNYQGKTWTVTGGGSPSKRGPNKGRKPITLKGPNNEFGSAWEDELVGSAPAAKAPKQPPPAFKTEKKVGKKPEPKSLEGTKFTVGDTTSYDPISDKKQIVLLKTKDKSIELLDRLPEDQRRRIIGMSSNPAFDKKMEGATLQKVPLKKIKPSQQGEDRLNDSSRETARAIDAGDLSDIAYADIRPIRLDSKLNIIDGNHRFTAAELNNQDYIYAWVAPSKRGVTNAETVNVFCSTGPGGGVDPTCKKGVAEGAAFGKPTTTEGLWGHSTTSVIRWMGKEGWDFKDSQRVLKQNGVNTSDATIRAQLLAGRKGTRGEPAKLSADQIKELNKQRGGSPAPKPVNPPKPLKPAKTAKPSPKPSEPEVKPPGPSPTKPTSHPDKPAHITYSGKPTEFGKQVWKKLQENSVRSEYGTPTQENVSNAELIGRMIISEANRRTYTPEVKQQLEAHTFKLAPIIEEKMRIAQELDSKRLWAVSSHPLTRRYDELVFKEAYLMRSTPKTAFAENLRAVMKEVRDYGGAQIPLKPKTSEPLREAMRQGSQNIPTDWINKIGDRQGPIKVIKGPRGYWRSDTREIRLSHNTASSGGMNALAAHEISHAMESSDSQIRLLGKAYRDKRVQASPLAKDRELSMIGEALPPEMGYRDEFFDHYVGREYGPRQPTEIISMGVEALHADPELFMRKDPSHAHFIIGLLSGA